MWVDTHCHLDAAEFDADRDTVADAAFACGVTTIVVPAVERANFGAVASVCRDYSGCHAAYGIHPMYVARAHDDDLIALRDMLSGERVVALGEIGLDRFVEQRDEARQANFFTAQLRLARDLQLPVLLHVRRAIDEVLKHLRAIRVCGGIAHAFNGHPHRRVESSDRRLVGSVQSHLPLPPFRWQPWFHPGKRCTSWGCNLPWLPSPA